MGSMTIGLFELERRATESTHPSQGRVCRPLNVGIARGKSVCDESVFALQESLEVFIVVQDLDII